jgi:hypothetical protein
MERNPYSPPSAALADVTSAPPTTVPREALLACKLSWLSYGLSVITSAIEIIRETKKIMRDTQALSICRAPR